MVLVVGEDTYDTLANALSYAEHRTRGQLFLAASIGVQEVAMREAVRYLDATYTFKGEIQAETQKLAFPRTDLYDDEGRLVTGTPDLVKEAQFELAFIAVEGPLVAGATSGVVRTIKAGSVSIGFDVRGANVSDKDKFKHIDRLLSGLYKHRAGARTRNIPLQRA